MQPTKSFVVINGEGQIACPLPVDVLIASMQKTQDENGMVGFPSTEGRMIWRRKGLILGFNVPSASEQKEEEKKAQDAGLGYDTTTDQG